MAVGRKLKLRLFIEGVEVPVISANIQTAPNSPAMASIQIPPMSEGCSFLPRSLIHLFFLDFVEVDSPLLHSTTASATTDDTVAPKVFDHPSSGEADLRNQQYKLLFGGELVGFQWTKTERSRSLVLQCSDFSNYWDYAYQFNNTDLFGPGVKAIFSGGATNLFTDFLDDQGSVISRIIKTPSVQYPALEGLLGGIVHLLEAIGGSYHGPKTFAGQNVFFSLAELRLHVTQMITASTKDDTASKLLNANGFDGLFSRTLSGLGAQVSFRQAINALMAIIFHETYAIPTPLYVPGTGGTISGYKRTKIADDPNNSFIVVAAEGLIQGLADVASAVRQGASLDRTQLPALRIQLGGARKTCNQTLQKIRAKQVQAAVSLFASASSSIGTASALLANWKPGDNGGVIVGKLLDAAHQLQKVADLEISTNTSKTAIPARLNQQIFRPDVWFSAPPQCNVLFPENYFAVNYQRSFLQEPTRLMLKTNDQFFGEDELFDNYYFAPKAFTVKSQKRELSAVLTNDLMDHELFTGILPVFEKMGELNIFAARSGTLKGSASKVGLAQRSTNFLYFKYRFAARKMTVSGRFNPYIVPGFPGLIIDKYIDTATLQTYNQLAAKVGKPTREINKLLGVHFLGDFTEVTHTVDQSGGKTDINCAYPRQPDESVEFLGAIANDQTVQKSTGTVKPTTTNVASLTAPRLLSIGPNKGQIVGVQDVTDKFAPSPDGTVNFQLPLYTTRSAGQSAVSVTIGVAQPVSAYGPQVVSLLGDDGRPITFRAYAIKEEAPQYSQVTVDLPAEEYIRPGWYGDIWKPSRIGEVYQEFFKTGAITDPSQVSDPNGGGTRQSDQQLDDATAAASNATSGNDPAVAAPAILSLDKNASIEQAVAFLVLVYSYIKNGNLSAEDFIRNYTWRPIASLIDLFGSADLQLSEDGAKVVQGVEGFHSRAFGQFDNLFGLVTPNIETIVGIKKGSVAAAKGDTRKRKQDAVLDYVAAITFSRAILG